jgi:hypothetical protein
MKNAFTALAASLVVAGCISTDMGTASKTAAPADGVNHERGTGSNISRKDRDVSVSGREELEKLQRPGGSNQIGKSGGR